MPPSSVPRHPTPAGVAIQSATIALGYGIPATLFYWKIKQDLIGRPANPRVPVGLTIAIFAMIVYAVVAIRLDTKRATEYMPWISAVAGNDYRDAVGWFWQSIIMVWLELFVVDLWEAGLIRIGDMPVDDEESLVRLEEGHSDEKDAGSEKSVRTYRCYACKQNCRPLR